MRYSAGRTLWSILFNAELSSKSLSKQLGGLRPVNHCGYIRVKHSVRVIVKNVNTLKLVYVHVLKRGSGGDRDPLRWGKRENIIIYT